MAEIESSLLMKIHNAGSLHERPVLIGFLRSRKKRIGTLIEATSEQSLKDLKREIKKKGGKKIKIYKEINTIYAEMPIDRVTELASVSCAQKVYDASSDVKLSLNQSVPLIMGIEKWELPYRIKGKNIEGHGIKVAVIDSGIAKNHPDLHGRIKRRKNFSGGRRNRGTEHGTHVAGIIAGSGKVSGYRYTGVAPRAKLYDIKVFINSEAPTTRHAVIKGILWAVKRKVDIINLSLGEARGCSDGTCILCKTADYAVNQGVTVVAAAGNDGPFEGTIHCPGNARHVITVGATTKSAPVMVTGFSSRGSLNRPDKPDVVAPGDKIIAPQPDGAYTNMSGTSMAAPHVSGAATLLYQASKYVNPRKEVSPADIKHVLKAGCIKLKEHTTAQGNGLVNFDNNLTFIQKLRKRPWFSKHKSISSQLAEQTVAAEASAPEQMRCPALLNMFCPHYDEHTCHTVYERCIHYQTAHQSKVLKTLKNI
jgi:subtilisin family serine protease